MNKKELIIISVCILIAYICYNYAVNELREKEELAYMSGYNKGYISHINELFERLNNDTVYIYRADNNTVTVTICPPVKIAGEDVISETMPDNNSINITKE